MEMKCAEKLPNLIFTNNVYIFGIFSKKQEHKKLLSLFQDHNEEVESEIQNSEEVLPPLKMAI